jgi:hypothetical protein
MYQIGEKPPADSRGSGGTPIMAELLLLTDGTFTMCLRDAAGYLRRVSTSRPARSYVTDAELLAALRRRATATGVQLPME